MATIVVLRHRFDRLRKSSVLQRYRPRYMIEGVLEVLRGRGHRILHCNRPDRVPGGDLLFLHVDCSLVPDEYIAAGANFPVVVNRAVRDITKRRISSMLVGPDDDWDGPVFVKSDLNTGGIPESLQNRNARRRLRRPPHPRLRVSRPYRRYASIEAVPAEIWTDPTYVVERYVTEEIDGLFASRNYIFCGTAERCSIHLSPKPVVKARDIVRSMSVDVPEELRRVRKELGFDYGKFDFVMDRGLPVLLDANKAVGAVDENPGIRERIRAGNASLADGLEAMLPA